MNGNENILSKILFNIRKNVIDDCELSITDNVKIHWKDCCSNIFLEKYGYKPELIKYDMLNKSIYIKVKAFAHRFLFKQDKELLKKVIISYKMKDMKIIHIYFV